MLRKKNNGIPPGCGDINRVFVAHYQGTPVTDTAVELSMGFYVS